MIGITTYVALGFIASLLFVTGVSYYDEGDNDFDAYAAAGVVGIIVVIAWPLCWHGTSRRT